MVASVVLHPSAGGPSTHLNRVMEGSQWLSMGLSISRPSRMSCLVMVTIHSQLDITLSHSPPGGRHPGLSADNFLPPNAANIGNRPQLEVLAPAAHLDIQPFRDEGSLVETSGSRRCRIILTRRRPGPDFRYMEGCSDFPGKPMEVCHTRNGLQFSPPGGGAQLICLIF